jgi:hexosaminidase
LLQARAGKFALPGGTVRDWPQMQCRYVHLYIPGREHLPFFRRYVRDFLLRYKFNGMVLEVGGGARLTRRPEIATGWKRTVMELQAHGDQVYKTGESCPLGPDNRFQDTTHHGIADGGWIEADDLRAIVAYARAHGQEVVPEIQSLTHVYHLACAHREIAELPDALFPDAYCPSNEDSYKILFDVMDEYIDVMSARTVHIGHDEWRAGGLCPKCREKRTGDLFARDVIRVYEHLRGKDVNVWMWGDHFISTHNEAGRSHDKGGQVWFDYPSTKGAWEQVKKACPDLVLLNWSWSISRDGSGAQGQCDQEMHDKGFPFLYGNFNGPGFDKWAERSARFNVLGAEISSWCTMNEFQIGKMHIAMALVGDFAAKVKVIESVDAALPGLLGCKPDVLLVTGDHSTPAKLKGHSWHPVPLLLWAPETARPDSETTFGERACARGGLGTFPSADLMALAFGHAGRLAKYGA